MKDILVIKLGALGDILLAEGALRDIREHHAGDRITMLTTPPYRALGERCPWVDRVWIDPRAPRWRLDRLWRLRRAFHAGRFDMVYDLQNSPRTELYFRHLFPPLSGSGTAAGCSHPHPRDDAAYGLARLSDQLRAAGVPVRFAERPSLAWMVDDAEETLRRAGVSRPFAVLVTGSSARNRAKRWPHFEELAAALPERGYAPVSVPGQDELRSQEPAATLRIVKTDGRWLDLFELSGVLERAALVVGNDTGPTHMAAMLGVPGVALLREPSGYAGQVLTQAGMIVLESADLTRIQVGAVLAAIDRLDLEVRCSGRPRQYGPSCGTRPSRQPSGGSQRIEKRDGREMTDGVFVELPERGIVAIEGPEARSFLQGLISSDVERVRPDRSCYGALLTPQGKFLFDFILLQSGERLLLDTERERLAPLMQRLSVYRLRSKLEISDASEDLAVGALFGPAVAERLGLPAEPGACRELDGGLATIDPRHAGLGARLVLPAGQLATTAEELGFTRASRDAYERLRITHGVPDGSRDLIVEKSTLLENGFEELHGVDFKKGCFVGQELTARMKYRALVRKRLMPVLLNGPVPEPGTVIRYGEREAGEMRSAIEGHGLALLRLEPIAKAAEEGVALRAGDTEVVPVKPD